MYKAAVLLQPKTRFSIVIPARNEAANIEVCVLSVLQNDYPDYLFEIIVVDDFSTDDTAAIVLKLQRKFHNLKLIQLKDHIDGKQNSYKKKSIETAISFAAYEWIITTDADCIVKPSWLQTFDAYIQQTNPVFIAAPVKFINTGSFLSVFQCLDFISLQGITAASVSAGILSMCNGANLAYKKDAFYAVGGFKNIDAIASGDDMLLMHKIKKQFPHKSAYLFSEDVIVSTPPMPDWKSFINQRIRWASKATSYDDKRIFFVLLLVYFVNLLLLVLPFLSIFYAPIFFLWLILLLSKIFFETIFMRQATAFFGEQKLMWWFPVMQLFHIVYTVVSGWLGKFGTYEWKGRNVK
ncbi:glycosyltransferase [Panacibacter ginsenosidivorans]|uniref:glycosyltransferase n=1 Tax=Panacibacter ginsenosidivorans TaxID=1813871 RepID=UPI00131545B3|nr:glycosyltransferase [Panacibacter ginsenosidivorans]